MPCGDRVELRVIDRGPGIPATDRDRMFVPFQRLGDTDNSTGVGLGLALSRGLTEAMGGTLEAEDTPGGGLTMALSLPAVSHPPHAALGEPAAHDARPASQSRTMPRRAAWGAVPVSAERQSRTPPGPQIFRPLRCYQSLVTGERGTVSR